MTGSKTMTDKPAPEKIVRAYISALNSGDPDAVIACVSDDFVNEHTSTLGENVVGRDVYRQRLLIFLNEFRELRYQIEDVIVDGQRVAVPYRMSATWRSPDHEKPGERPFSIRGMFRFRVSGDHITHRVDYWDSADFKRQIGEQ